MYRYVVLYFILFFVSACQQVPSTSSVNDTPIVNDPDWQQRYSPDVAYFNRTQKDVPIRNGADTKTRLIGTFGPDEGGYVQTCAMDTDYCLIRSFGDPKKIGYVDMSQLSGEAH